MLNERLSDNFILAEAIKSRTALEHGIDNTPNAAEKANITMIAVEILEPTRAHFGRPISPSSWFRCLQLEKVICAPTIKRIRARVAENMKGESVSDMVAAQDKAEMDYLNRKQHPAQNDDGASDFEVGGVPNIVVARWIAQNLIFDQLILEFYDPDDPAAGWVHASRRRVLEDNRREVKRFDGSRYLPGLGDE